MNTPTLSVISAAVRAWLPRALVIPAWLEPRLQSVGAAIWSHVSRADARKWWRWLALNWQKVAAWWLTFGLGLTALFMLAAFAAWQNPEVMLMRALGWSARLIGAGGKLAGWGGLGLLVLSLPALLPAALVLLAGVLVGAVALGLFGPLLLIGGAAFGALLVMATLKRGFMWGLSFVWESLGHSDQRRKLAHGIREALGFARASTSLDGTPRLMEGDELGRYEAANKAANRGGPVLLGKVNGKPFFHWTEKHLFMVAAARSGKGRDLIIPNLKVYPESVFVLDPKGENCKATAATREGKHGNRVAAFDPYGLTGRKSARFNPLAGLGGDMVRGADYLAEALVIGPADHWNESARGLIRALVLHILTADDATLGHRPRDLPTLRELLTGYLDLTLASMQESEAAGGLVSRLAESFISTPPNEKGGIVSTARRSTKWLDNAELADLFRATPKASEGRALTAAGQGAARPDDGLITFDDLRDPAKRLSVFVCLPPDVFSTYPQVCRLLTTFALDTMMRSLTSRKRPVMFILDELAQLDHLPIVERGFTLGAGYGIQVWAVFQSVAQAQKLYPLDALYGSSGIRCFFNLADPESVEYASKCGSGVMAPADVRRMAPLEMLTLLDNANPMIIERLGPPQGGKHGA